MAKVKLWKASSKVKAPELNLMIKGVFEELRTSDPGDYTMLIAGDTMVIGLKDIDRKDLVYHCKIISSTEDAPTQAEEWDESDINCRQKTKLLS